VLTKDEPALLFLSVQGINECTTSTGCFDSSAEQSAITFASATDSTGVFSCVVKVFEPLAKVCNARIISRAGSSDIVSATFPTGATSGISSGGDKIVLNFDAGRDFSSANGDYCLEVEYVIAD
jgi:hypothetical protein